MKRLLLPLVATATFLTALVPRADAGAITVHHGSLNPRLIGAGKLHRRFNNGVPAPGFRTNHFVAAISESIEESLVNAVSSGALTLTKTGAGTLVLSAGTLSAGTNATGFLSGSVTLDHSAIVVGGTNGGLIDVNGLTLTLTGPNTLGGNGTLTINTGVLTGGDFGVNAGTVIANPGSLSIGGSGTLVGSGTINLGSLGGTIINGTSGTVNVNAGTVNFGANQTLGALNISDGAVVALNLSSAAPAPVPEPGAAMLFALGVLAASQARRRCA